ncbi:tRNA1(Val) A37 N6-methylase TrmN6 [Methylopila jiangsuensis]|uniref:tRNA1(Val) (adenine(37)-N6)-methyltransferase n=1 Tax=Methylopila jiangsuensis TaxID=586230 RepID=UPI0022F33D56|nr:methyltransferase [Methylopila jiangsuensis]MDR6287132.1 tRNA1(Val) A37 N6-methylase TrmN6 [Methylopila jiangsuensis]
MTGIGSAPADGLTEDGFFGGRLRLLQPRRGHRVGTDAALLTAAARGLLKDGDRIAEFGAGVGAVGLSLALSGAESATLVEIDPATAELARDNARRNGVAAAVLTADVADVGRPGLGEEMRDAFDLVVANPPFDAVGRFRASPQADRARAHAAGEGLAEIWVRAAARLLRPGGHAVMIHRPEAIGELVAAFGGRFGDLRLKPVQARADGPAIRLLVSARKGRRGALTLSPPFVLHGPDGAVTLEAHAVQRGQATLPL